MSPFRIKHQPPMDDPPTSEQLRFRYGFWYDLWTWIKGAI